MASNTWLDAVQAGLAANLPTPGATGWAQGTVFSNNSTPGTPTTSVNEAPSFPGNKVAFYYATDTGTLYIWNPATQAWTQNVSASVAAGLTGGTGSQTQATALTAKKNTVTTAATTGAGVLLPSAATVGLGYELWLANQAAYNIGVYPNTNDTIDALAANTGATLTTLKQCFFTVTSITGASGTWVSGPQGGHTA